MSEVVQGGQVTETPVNPYSLLEAVNSSSETANTAWLIFLAIMAYLMVAVAGVTHRDLLLETPVSLPVLDVQIQQRQFFQFAPIILVLFHIGLVSQLVLLARKTLEFDFAVRALESTDRRTHPLRLELDNFFFVQAIAGPHRSAIMSTMLHGISWLTLAILPVILLLYIQISFLPYHSVSVTWTHRICLFVDILLLMLLGTFLMRLETSFWSAFVRTSVHQPIAFVATGALMLATIFFSFLVATIPGEKLDVMAATVWRPSDGNSNANLTGFLRLPLLIDANDGTLLGFFHRNLIVTDTDLVPDQQGQDGEATVVLRGRDLRFARLDRSDLHGSDLTGADLDGASLVGADLRGARIQCADLTEVMLTENRVKAHCPSAQRARFDRARLNGAKLSGADFTDASFDEADLEAVEAPVALFTGASFSSARLDKADLTGGVNLNGANFLLATLQGVDLTGAQMQFADFTSAQLQGAVISHANLRGALLRDANLEAADLSKSKLQGADMNGAVVAAADMRGAGIWLTAPPSVKTATLGDFTQVEMSAPSQVEVEGVLSAVGNIANAVLRIRMEERLSAFKNVSVSRNWAGAPDHQTWLDLMSQSQSMPPDYDQQISNFLVQMMCRPRWRNGSVATGILKRGQATQFRGNLRQLHERASASDCQNRIDPKLLAKVASRVDVESNTMPPPPAPSPANNLGLQP